MTGFVPEEVRILSAGRAEITIIPYGDGAVLLEAHGPDADARWQTTEAIRRLVLDAALPGLTDLIASYEHILVQFDPTVTDADAVQADLSRLVDRQDLSHASIEGRDFTIPVSFAAEHSPDLPDVAAFLGLSTAEVIAELLQARYSIRFLGAGMEPMSSGLPFDRPIPRRSVPRPRVPAGSLSVAGAHISFYPHPSPGGWQILGRTPYRLTDITQQPPVRYGPGDTYRLRAIEADEWTTLEGRQLDADDG